MTEKKSPGRPRGSSKRTTKMQRKNNKGLPAAVNETTKTYDILQHVKSGKTVAQAADLCDTSTDSAKKLIRKAMKDLRERSVELAQFYQDTSMAQTDMVLGKIIASIESSETPDRDSIISFEKIMKLRIELMNMTKGSSQGNQINIQFNNTFGSSDVLYEEARENIYENDEDPLLLQEGIDDTDIALIHDLDEVSTEYVTGDN